MLFEPKKECLDRDELLALQLEALQAVLARVYLHVPFYRKRFDEQKIDPDEIRTLDNLRRLPMTTRQDLQDNYPYGLFAVPLREVVRIHASTCMSAVVGYTKNDIKTWSNLVARVLCAGGVTKDDVVQIAFSYELSTGGFGAHYGAERIGASVIPTSTGNTHRQIKIMRDFRTTALLCTPSYAAHIAETIHREGMNLGEFSLKFGIFGGEPWSEAMRTAIQEKLGILATDNYGLSEVMGPGVACECPEQNGLHINEDHFLVEIVDPVTQNPVPEGEEGELVITTLTKEAFPVIRFRTRDRTRLLSGTCPCGRTFTRMARVEKRTDDILIVRGVKVDPRHVGLVLTAVEGKLPPHQLLLEQEGTLDKLTVLVSAGESQDFDELKIQHERMEHLRRRLSSELGVSVVVRLVERKSLDANLLIVDRRQRPA